MTEPQPASGDYDLDAVVAALDIGPDSLAVERTVDITTIGAKTGLPRRLEIWFHHVEGRWFITGIPVARSWYSNVRANPRFVLHLKHGVHADLPATALAVDSETRRRVIAAVLDLQKQPDIASRVSRPQSFDEWYALSPLIEIKFDDKRIHSALAHKPNE